MGNEWNVGAELGAADVVIDGSELAAYRLARMSARLVQHLPGTGVDPASVWHTLAAWCPVDFMIGRAVAALGRSPRLQGHSMDVRAIRGVQAFTAIESSCTLHAAVRVQSSSPLTGGATELNLDVALTRDGDARLVVRFGLVVWLRPL